MLKLKIETAGVEVPAEFEHSLLSVSKWESLYKTPFLTAEKTAEQMIDYYQCMLLSPDDPSLIFYLAPEQMEELTNYINSSLTASSIPRSNGRPSREIVTSESIYYWMLKLKIPFWPTETWHLTRLMALIEMTLHHDTPQKKVSKAQGWQDMRAIHEANKKKMEAARG